MRNIFQNLLLTTSLLLISACSMPTHLRNVSPYLDGKLKFNEQPVQNIKIMLSVSPNDKLCFKARKTTETDENGHFRLTPATEEHTYKPFLNYEFHEWFVCARYNNQRYTLYSNNHYSSNNSTETLPSNCGIACSDQDDQQNTFYYENRQSSDSVVDSVHLDCDLALRPISEPCVVSH